jgi:putative transposase
LPSRERRELIERGNPELSLRQQCNILGVNRSGIYYRRKPPVSKDDLEVMHRIDEIWTRCPFYGVLKVTKQLHREGMAVNHKRVARLMGIMGIEAIFPRRNLSLPGKGQEIHPYLIKNLAINHPDQVWGVDITYVRLRKDWLYLFALLDWFSRRVLAWSLSDSLEAGFCCQALEEALKDALPEIHNSDQGSQLTSNAYLGILKRYPSIRISMDGRGRAFDNIFTERLWRTVKYEEIYLKDYQSPKEASQSLTEYFRFYNEERLHQALDYQTPNEVYFSNGRV